MTFCRGTTLPPSVEVARYMTAYPRAICTSPASIRQELNGQLLARRWPGLCPVESPHWPPGDRVSDQQSNAFFPGTVCDPAHVPTWYRPAVHSTHNLVTRRLSGAAREQAGSACPWSVCCCDGQAGQQKRASRTQHRRMPRDQPSHTASELDFVHFGERTRQENRLREE